MCAFVCAAHTKVKYIFLCVWAQFFPLLILSFLNTHSICRSSIHTKKEISIFLFRENYKNSMGRMEKRRGKCSSVWKMWFIASKMIPRQFLSMFLINTFCWACGLSGVYVFHSIHWRTTFYADERFSYGMIYSVLCVKHQKDSKCLETNPSSDAINKYEHFHINGNERFDDDNDDEITTTAYSSHTQNLENYIKILAHSDDLKCDFTNLICIGKVNWI